MDLLIADRCSTSGAGDPAQRPELGTEGGDEVRWVFGIVRLDEAVVIGAHGWELARL